MKKKHNWILITILTIICLITILGLFLFLKTDFFRTKRSAFLRYFDDIPEALAGMGLQFFDQKFKHVNSIIFKHCRQ